MLCWVHWFVAILSDTSVDRPKQTTSSVLTVIFRFLARQNSENVSRCARKTYPLPNRTDSKLACPFVPLSSSSAAAAAAAFLDKLSGFVLISVDQMGQRVNDMEKAMAVLMQETGVDQAKIDAAMAEKK